MMPYTSGHQNNGRWCKSSMKLWMYASKVISSQRWRRRPRSETYDLCHVARIWEAPERLVYRIRSLQFYQPSQVRSQVSGFEPLEQQRSDYQFNDKEIHKVNLLPDLFSASSTLSAKSEQFVDQTNAVASQLIICHSCLLLQANHCSKMNWSKFLYQLEHLSHFCQNIGGRSLNSHSIWAHPKGKCCLVSNSMYPCSFEGTLPSSVTLPTSNASVCHSPNNYMCGIPTQTKWCQQGTVIVGQIQHKKKKLSEDLTSFLTLHASNLR